MVLFQANCKIDKIDPSDALVRLCTVLFVCACACVCVRACVRVRVRACTCLRVCARVCTWFIGHGIRPIEARYSRQQPDYRRQPP